MDDYGALRDKEKADMKEEIRDLRHEIESARARLHTANLARIAAVKGAPRETNNMTTHENHAKEIADQRALCREAVQEAYAEAFDDAWNLARGLDADEGLIQECWLKSGAACDFKREERDDD